MKVGIIAPGIYPLGQLDRYGGIERLCSLFLKGLREVAPEMEVGCLCPSGSVLPRGVERWNSGPAVVDFNEIGNQIWSGRLVPFGWTYLDFSHSKWLGRQYDPIIHQLSIIWHDPLQMSPPQPKHNVVALSQWQADRFRKTTGQTCLVMDPHCFEPGPTIWRGPLFAADLGLPEDFCLFIGKLGPDKGALEAIQACLKIKENLVLIGPVTPGDPPEYVQSVRALCDGTHIIYLGEVSEAVKWHCFHKAKCLIYPASYKEGFGESHSHKSAESIYAGLPVVALDNGATREVIQDGVTGVVISDLAQLADGIARCCQLDRAEVARVGQKWDYRQVVRNWMPLIERVSQGERW